MNLRTMTGGLMVGLLLGVAGCSGSSPSSSDPSSGSGASGEPQKLTMSIVTENIAFLPIYVGLARDTFSDGGIDLQLTNAQSGAAVIQSIVGNATNVGSGQADSVITSTAAGAPPTEIIGNLTDSPTSLLTISTAALDEKNVTVDKFKDMKPKEKARLLDGMTVATFGPGGLVDNQITQILESAGLDKDSVTRVTIPGAPQELAALRAGQVDAIVVSPPEPLQAETEGFAVVAGPVGDFSPLLKELAYESVFVTQAFAKDNADLLRTFGKALAEACNQSREDDPKSLADDLLGAGYFKGQDADLLAQSIESAQAAYPENCTVSDSSISNLLDFTKANGTVEGELPEAADIYTNDYLPGS